jgi:hypothetical protein
MKFLRHWIAVAALHFLQGIPVDAQPPTGQLPETKVVLRISREFILELTGKQFRRDEPIHKKTFGAIVEGTALVTGRFDVGLQRSDSAAEFDLLVNGEILTRWTATSRAVQVYAHGFAAFQGRRRIAFDGNAFTGQAIDMGATYRSDIDRICSFRTGPFGELSRDIADPLARLRLPRADGQAENQIRNELSTAIEKDTDHLLLAMNKVGPLLKQGEEILRQEKVLSASSVEHYLAATEQHLYMSLGPPGHRIPELPRLDVSQRGPIEMWIAIKKVSTGDSLTPVLKHWELVKPFVLQRIARESPELVKIVEHVQVESVAGWYVVRFAPKLLVLP